MQTRPASESSVTGTEPSRILRQELQALSDQRRAAHPLLARQNAIGLSIFLLSCAAIVANGWAYYRGSLPAWVVVPVAAFFMSLLHELEHDLIHRLYFKTRPLVYNLMLLGVWLFRPSTVSPWVRRDWHFNHHRVSGMATDLEERGITNGEPWGLRRLLMTADGILAIVLRPHATRDMLIGYAKSQKAADKRAYRRILWRNRLSYFPLGNLHFALWHTFLFVHGAELACALLGRPLHLPPFVTSSMPFIDFMAVVLLGPNVLRSFCLNFVSSNIHYYGDISPRNVVQQTQVWTSAWTFPLQLFCFNFGGTHAIHHFVVQEPFYLRQLIAWDAYPIMRAHGVRFDDFASMRHANRWGTVQADAEATVPSAARAVF